MQAYKNGTQIVNQLNKILPKNEIKKDMIKNEADYYGISRYIARKLSLPFWPISSCSFRHGWHHQDNNAIDIIKNHILSSNYLVPSDKDVDIFHHDNIYNVDAVGLPYIYVDQNDIQDIKKEEGSLLVMPPHSLPESSNNWDETTYLDEIDNIAHRFTSVVFCIHQSCVDKHLWIKNFESRNIPYIIGANLHDLNSLERMAMIFQSFEYMTTNTFGSHLSYASYQNCKVSIYGTFLSSRKKDFENIEFYKNNPNYLDLMVESYSIVNIKKNYGEFFTEPWNATLKKDWADEVLGKKHKVSYERLAKLLGWKDIDFPRISFDEEYNFGKYFRDFIVFSETLKQKYSKILIYGAGSIGKTTGLLLGENCIGFIDKLSRKNLIDKKIYKLEDIENLEYDCIFISNIGTEKEIISLLIKKNICQDKIIHFNLDISVKIN